MNAENGAESFAIHLDNSSLERQAEEAARLIEGIGQKAVEEARRIDKALDELPRKIEEQEKTVQELTDKYDDQKNAIDNLDKQLLEHKELLELNRKEVEQTQQAYEKAKESKGEWADSTKKLKEEMDNAKEGVKAEQQAIRDLNIERQQEKQTLNEINQERQKEKQTLSDLQSEYKKTSKEGKDLGRTLTDAVKKHEAELKKIPSLQQQIADSMKTVGKLSAGYLTIGAAKKFIAKSIEVRKELEMTEQQFEGLFGAQAGSELLGGLKDISLDSGVYKLGGLAQAVETLNVYGEKTEDILPLVREFGDIAMGNEQKMNSLAMAVGRLNTQGNLNSLTLRTMIRAGFNPLDEMARTTGKSMEQLNAEMKAGMITTQMVKDAMKSATSEGGKYHNMTERLSDSIAGEQTRLSTMIAGIYAKWGEEHEDLIKGGYKVAQTLVQNYDAIGKTIAVLITTYGAYRAALITTAAVESAINAHYVTKIRLLRAAAVAQAALNRVMMMNPYVLAATALTGLVAATIAFSKESDLAGAESKRLKDRLDEQAKSQSDLKDEVKKNTDAINDDTKSESDRQTALNELKRLLPSVFDKYANWIELQKDLAAATAAANDELARQNAIQKGENVNYDRQMLADLKRYRDLINSRFGDDKNHTVLKMRAELKKKYPDLFQEGSSWRLNGQGTFQTEISAYNDLIKKVAASVEKDGKDLVKETGKMWDGMLPGKSLDKLQQEATQYEKMLAQLKKQNDPAELQKRWNKQNEDSHMQIFGFKLKTMPPAYTAEAQQQMKNESSMVYDWVNGQYITKEELERRLGIIRSHTATIRKNQDKDFLKESKEAYEAGQKELENFIASKRDTNLYPTEAAWQEAIRKKRAEVEQLKKNYENNGGSVKKDTKAGRDAERERKAMEEANEKMEQERIRWENEQAKRRAEGRNLAAQAEIDAMQEGEKKKLAQLELNHQRELQQIEQEAKDLYEAKVKHEKALWDANPANKGKDFYKEHPYDRKTGTYSGIAKLTQSELQATGITSKIESANARYNQELHDIMQEELQALYTFLSEFGTIEQRRYAIIKDYEERIAKETNDNRKKMLQAERDGMLAKLNAESIAENIDWNQTFTGIGNVLEGIAKETLKKVNDYMGTDEFKKLRPADKQPYMELRDRLIQAGGVESSSPFNMSTWNDLDRLAKQYRDKVAEFLSAQETHKKAVDQLIKAEQELKNATTPTAKAIAQANVQIAQQQVDTTAQAVTEAKDKKDNAQQQVHDQSEKAAQGLRDFNTVLGQITSGTLSGFATGVYNLVNQISGSGKKVAASLGEIGGKAGGLIGAILQIIDALGTEPTKFIDDILKKVADVIEAILSQLPQIILSVIKGVGNIVGGVIKGIGNLFSGGAAFGSNEAEMEAIIQEMAETNKNLATAIDGLKEQISKSDSTNKESLDAYKKALQAEKEWEANQRRAIDAMASEWTNSGYGFLGLGGKGSFNAHMAGNDWYGWRRFTEELGKHGFNTTVNSDNIWTLSPEEMKILKEFAPSEWAALFNGDGHRNPKDLVEEYIQRAGMQEELTSAMNQKLTGYDWEGFIGSYKKMLKDLDSTTEDFADHIKEMMSNALIESFVNEELKEDIDSLYKYIAKAAEDGLDAVELREIDRQNEAIANRSLAWRQSMIDAGMIQPTSDSKYSQSGSTNSLSSMSEDTGQEMNGRLTSIQLGIFTIVDAIQQQAVNVMGIAQSTSGIHSMMSDMLDMQSEAVDHLAKIEKNTNELPTIRQDIAKIKTNTSALTTKK